MQTYLVHLRHALEGGDGAVEAVADLVTEAGGFVLMALSTGALVVALDESHVARVKADRHVEFCGGVTLDPKGKAAEQLRHLFAQNIASQLAVRPTVGTPQPVSESAYPPGYRPLRWGTRGSGGTHPQDSTEHGFTNTRRQT